MSSLGFYSTLISLVSANTQECKNPTYHSPVLAFLVGWLPILKGRALTSVRFCGQPSKAFLKANKDSRYLIIPENTDASARVSSGCNNLGTPTAPATKELDAMNPTQARGGSLEWRQAS